MKSLFEKVYVEEIINRVNKLNPQTQRLWGTMNVHQMLAHCSVGMRTATGEIFLKSGFFLKLIGSFFKSNTTNDKPLRKSSPTHPGFIITSVNSFENEKEELIQLMNKFHEGGKEKCTTDPHAFFGKLTPVEWGSLMYKHIDHHFRQFGV